MCPGCPSREALPFLWNRQLPPCLPPSQPAEGIRIFTRSHRAPARFRQALYRFSFFFGREFLSHRRIQHRSLPLPPNSPLRFLMNRRLSPGRFLYKIFMFHAPQTHRTAENIPLSLYKFSAKSVPTDTFSAQYFPYSHCKSSHLPTKPPIHKK